MESHSGSPPFEREATLLVVADQEPEPFRGLRIDAVTGFPVRVPGPKDYFVSARRTLVCLVHNGPLVVGPSKHRDLRGKAAVVPLQRGARSALASCRTGRCRSRGPKGGRSLHRLTLP